MYNKLHRLLASGQLVKTNVIRALLNSLHTLINLENENTDMESGNKS